MEESYIRGVNQELIRTLKKLIEVTENFQKAVISELNKATTSITGKLDTIISNQHEISITADTINLNTDTVEAKLDEVKASIEAMQTEVITELTTTHTDMNGKLDTINGTTNTAANNAELINTSLGLINTIVTEIRDNKLGTPTAEGDTVISLLEDVKTNTTPATV